MKQETNNEMDLLLRRLGRRDETTVSNADHLDADELSAYAENALPAPARARYTLHLAECSRCRSLAVQLSSSAGVVAATESAAVTGPSGFKKFLASLFTPMVLRYAAPALGLIVVAVIGFVVLRSNEPARFVAQDTNTEQRPTSPVQEPNAGQISESATKTEPAREDSRDKQTRGQTAGSPPPPNMAPVVTSVETDLAKDKAAAQPKPEEQRAAANEAPPAKPEPSATPADTEVTKKEVRELPVNPRQSEKSLQAAERQEKTDKDNFGRARKPADAVSAPAAGVASAGTGSAARIQRDGVDDSSGETRSVAGRRFRKQDGVWVDTAYNRSKDPVTLRRDSEQYRALIADEPGIKTIADTLDGEIIVVWKGRTYRIR